jgi:hypothetical protein
MDPHEYLRSINFTMTAAPLPAAPSTPRGSSAPIASAPSHHRAPPPLPHNYSEEAMGCQGKGTPMPIRPGQPGYPGFVCQPKVIFDKPLIATEIKPTQMVQGFVAGATGGRTGVSIANMPTKPAATGAANVPASRFPSGNAPGSHLTQTQQPEGTVTPAAFASACQQNGGRLGTPNCCAFPDGTAFGLQAGQLVQVLQCTVDAYGDKKSGLGGQLPLIAGVAVLALLLTRGM